MLWCYVSHIQKKYFETITRIMYFLKFLKYSISQTKQGKWFENISTLAEIVVQYQILRRPFYSELFNSIFKGIYVPRGHYKYYIILISNMSTLTHIYF